MDGRALPDLKTELPGPKSRRHIDILARTECPAITARRARRQETSGVDQDPIVWAEALGANVKDVDGNVFVDFTAAFGVATLGHRNPAVVKALEAQSGQLIHAMGDVFPADIKIHLSEKLADLTPGDLTQSILGLSGSDAVEAALKTAVIHTGKPGVLTFEGSYHGLSYGPLAVSGYRSSFKKPFVGQLASFASFMPFPDTFRPPLGLPEDASSQEVVDACLTHIRNYLTGPASGAVDIGAVLIEPIQGRGGERPCPPGFLPGLRQICDELGMVLIFDEIYTGLGRTGTLFALEDEGVLCDILCLGKSLGGGMPLSAAIGRDDVMKSWALSQGESIHTQTFLGHPLSCAAAMAVLTELEEGPWLSRVQELGDVLLGALSDMAQKHEIIGEVRGRGLMLGVDIVEEGRVANPAAAFQIVQGCRDRGYLLLPSGVHGNVIAITPPFCLHKDQMAGFLAAFEIEVEKAASKR